MILLSAKRSVCAHASKAKEVAGTGFAFSLNQVSVSWNVDSVH
jgi:hypothetical protein